MKKIVVLVIVVLLVLSACGRNIEKSDSNQSSLVQSQYLFRNVNFGMTKDDVEQSEKKNDDYEGMSWIKNNLVLFNVNVFDVNMSRISYIFDDDKHLKEIEITDFESSNDDYESIKKYISNSYDYSESKMDSIENDYCYSLWETDRFLIIVYFFSPDGIQINIKEA